jgi:hypothetical protein
MQHPETERFVPPAQLRIMQIIAGALIGGVAIFLGIVLFLVHGLGQGPANPQEPMLTYVALLLLVVNVPLASVVPRMIEARGIAQIAAGTWRPPGAAETSGDAGRLMQLFQQSLIIGLAILEGVAFLACVAYLLEAQSIAVVVAGLPLLFMIIRFPTQNRCQAWLDNQLDRVVMLRHDRGLS